MLVIGCMLAAHEIALSLYGFVHQDSGFLALPYKSSQKCKVCVPSFVLAQIVAVVLAWVVTHAVAQSKLCASKPCPNGMHAFPFALATGQCIARAMCKVQAFTRTILLHFRITIESPSHFTVNDAMTVVIKATSLDCCVCLCTSRPLDLLD
mmetsp:Transcript_14724/g.23984  ORF Transcript_14724/g.23984 Transcript_14724/m.23984 type:complete len:151 (-) Transcript_14724:434-886(-)